MERKKPGRKAERATKKRIAWPRWTGFQGRTVWDLLQLLIVPLALAVIGFAFTMQQDARQQNIEDQRADSERELEEQRAQDAALQAYLDQMSQLILERNLLEAEEGDPAYVLAQARTSTVIARLDEVHNESVIGFLTESGLLGRTEDYSSASLLRGINLQSALLIDANLFDADLSDADLSDANFLGTDLSGADLSAANLSGAILSNTDLSSAELANADLSGAELVSMTVNEGGGLDESPRSFRAALGLPTPPGEGSGMPKCCTNLEDANLEDANLKDAKLMGVELEQQAASLEGATMPDGSKHP